MTGSIRIREAIPEDRSEWLQMRCELWPGSLSDHDAETRRFFDDPDEKMRTFVAEGGAGLVGFLELDQRKYAPGCESSPVPFIEGWYVDPGVRRQGIGRALVRAAEAWALSRGFHEIGSDVEMENSASISAHGALGFVEIERVVYFRRSLRGA